MTTFEDDQSTSATLVMNGTHTSINAAQLKAVSPAGTVFTFTASYRHAFNGQNLDFRKGASYALDTALKTRLLAAGAPMVAA
jgi:hypothetical protein